MVHNDHIMVFKTYKYNNFDSRLKDLYIWYMEFPLGTKTVYRTTSHFCERWVERNPDDWDRFLWVLDNNAHFVMCKDDSGRMHCLHYNPTDDMWFVFILGKRTPEHTFPLITILPEEYYRKMSNAVIADNHKTKAIELLQDKNVLKCEKNRLVLHFRLNGYGERRIIKIPFSWDLIWPTPDLYPIHINFEERIGDIMELPAVVAELSRKFPAEYQSVDGWIRLFSKFISLELSMEYTEC